MKHIETHINHNFDIAKYEPFIENSFNTEDDKKSVHTDSELLSHKLKNAKAEPNLLNALNTLLKRKEHE